MNDLIFHKLNDPKDYEKVSELIYKTDKYIYSDLFGSANTAKVILNYLFDDPQSIFCKENYYVAKLREELVGIAALYRYGTRWSKNKTQIAFYECHMKIPDSFDAVSNYFNATFNYIRFGVNACNICVDEKYQRQRIGSFILENLIKISGKSDIELVVLAENMAAVKLYIKYDFTIIDEFDDYGGYENKPVKCYRMIRQHH